MRRYLAAAALGCAVAAWFWWWTSPVPVRVFLAPPAGSEFDGPPAFSPDGTSLAAAISRNGARSLAVIKLAGRDVREFDGTEDAQLPFWSPDGRSVGFFAQGQFKTLELASRRVTTLCPAPGPWGGAWGPNGTIVFAPSGHGPLYRISPGGTASPITTPDPGTSHRWPQFLPDGRILYAAVADGREPEIYVGARRILQGPERAVFTPHEGGLLVYASGTRLLAVRFDSSKSAVVGEPRLIAPYVTSFRLFSAGAEQVSYQTGDPDRSRRLVWFDRDGRGQPIGEPARYSLPRVSPDGRNILVARSDSTGQTNIWLMDATSGISRSITAEKQRASDPVWSPDGTQFLYAAQRGERYMIVRASLGAPTAGQAIFESDASAVPASWSAKGSILFDRPNDNFHEIWVIPAEGAQPIAVAKFDPQSGLSARLSPDGNWIAFSSNGVFVAPFHGQPVAPSDFIRVSSGAGFDPEWSADGKELFYIAADRKWIAVPIETANGFQPGEPAALFTPGDYQPGFGYSPATGAGRFLLNLRTSEPDRELTVVRLR